MALIILVDGLFLETYCDDGIEVKSCWSAVFKGFKGIELKAERRNVLEGLSEDGFGVSEISVL